MVQIEARITELESDLEDQQAKLHEAKTELKNTATLIRDARKAIADDVKMRRKTETVKQVVGKIVVNFEPTERTHPKSTPWRSNSCPLPGALKSIATLPRVAENDPLLNPVLRQGLLDLRGTVQEAYPRRDVEGQILGVRLHA